MAKVLAEATATGATALGHELHAALVVHVDICVPEAHPCDTSAPRYALCDERVAFYSMGKIGYSHAACTTHVTFEHPHQTLRPRGLVKACLQKLCTLITGNRLLTMT